MSGCACVFVDQGVHVSRPVRAIAATQIKDGTIKHETAINMKERGN